MRLVAHLLALGVVCLIASLTPLAFADPPDQTWLGGYWDNDDFDEVVVFITHSCGLVDVSAPHIPECEGVARLELPGVVRFDGRPITELDLRELRRRAALVLQTPVLFEGSVRDNLRVLRASRWTSRRVACARCWERWAWSP